MSDRLDHVCVLCHKDIPDELPCSEPVSDCMHLAVTLAELVTYIKEAPMNALVAPVFVLADLTALYPRRWNSLGTVVIGRVHSTKFKNRILRYFPYLDEHKQDGDVACFRLDPI